MNYLKKKAEFLKHQKLLELEIETEKIIKVQEKLKIAQLKEYFDNTCLECDVYLLN